MISSLEALVAGENAAKTKFSLRVNNLIILKFEMKKCAEKVYSINIENWNCLGVKICWSTAFWPTLLSVFWNSIGQEISR